MERDLQQFTEDFLKKSEQRKPVPTHLAPHIQSIPGIKALFFDIYGTLVISSSGDVDIETIVYRNVLTALETAGVMITAEDPLLSASMLRTLLVGTISRIHAEHQDKGIPFPEVDIIDVWEQVFGAEECKKMMILPYAFDFRRFALIFELFNNPVSPMPDMNFVLQTLTERGFSLGIISNAQFYTPILLHYFINGSVDDTETIGLFSPELCFYSYKHLRAKPDLYLYEKAKEALIPRGIRAHEVLFIGNDMKKDILPAKQTGFNTVLFAGDERSLRLHHLDIEGEDSKPDCIITELSQILSIIK